MCLIEVQVVNGITNSAGLLGRCYGDWSDSGALGHEDGKLAPSGKPASPESLVMNDADGWVELAITGGCRRFAKPLPGTGGQHGVILYEHELPQHVREYFKQELPKFAQTVRQEVVRIEILLGCAVKEANGDLNNVKVKALMLQLDALERVGVLWEIPFKALTHE